MFGKKSEEKKHPAQSQGVIKPGGYVPGTLKQRLSEVKEVKAFLATNRYALLARTKEEALRGLFEEEVDNIASSKGLSSMASSYILKMHPECLVEIVQEYTGLLEELRSNGEDQPEEDTID